MFSADFIVGIAQLDNCYNHRTVPKLTPSPYAVPGIREANIKTVKENYGKDTANKKKNWLVELQAGNSDITKYFRLVQHLVKLKLIRGNSLTDK